MAQCEWQPGLGHIFFGLSLYLLMIIAIVTVGQGLSREIVCSVIILELPSVQKSSYSPAKTFSCPGPDLNWSCMITCILLVFVSLEMSQKKKTLTSWSRPPPSRKSKGHVVNECYMCNEVKMLWPYRLPAVILDRNTEVKPFEALRLPGMRAYLPISD